MGFIDSNGNYYEGMKLHKSHTETPNRPSRYHNWSGIEWVEDTIKKKFDEDAELLETMIQEELRTIAIDSLKAKGKI